VQQTQSRGGDRAESFKHLPGLQKQRGLFDEAAMNYCDEFIWPIIEPMEAVGAGRDSIVAYFLALALHLRDSPIRWPPAGA